MIGEGDWWAVGGVKIGKGNGSTRRKPAPTRTRNPTWQDPGSNPGRRGGKIYYSLIYNSILRRIKHKLRGHQLVDDEAEFVALSGCSHQCMSPRGLLGRPFVVTLVLCTPQHQSVSVIYAQHQYISLHKFFIIVDNHTASYVVHRISGFLDFLHHPVF
jgi:hypothetical protein